MQNAVKQVVDEDLQVFVGRQPIFDCKLSTCAYELLFRPGSANEAVFVDGEKATAQVIHNTLMELGLDELVGSDLAYINFTRNCLMGDIAHLLPPERVVLEILEDVEVDDALIASVKSLVKAGFTVALDDFEYSEKWEPLIELASIIKFDVRATSIEEIEKQLNSLKNRSVKFLAEKVENQEEYTQLKALGFDYFQGYFFSKPNVVSSRKLPDSHLTLLNLISRLQDPEIEIEEIEKLVSNDISLSYKLLRYINSALFSLPKKVNSIRQVVVYFGIQRLKNWTSLMAMAGVSGKPPELLQTGLIRAKMCELLGVEASHGETDCYFMLGLFSILDALMDSSMQDVLEKLPIAEEVSSALLEHEGQLGAALNCCIACEQSNWHEMKFAGLKDGAINRLYMQAIQWSRQASGGLT